MKGFIIGCLILCQLRVFAQESVNFRWLEGTWKSESNQGYVYEQWIKAGTNKWECRGGEVYKKDTVFKEFITLQKIHNYWVYIPVLGKQDPVLFTMRELESNLYIFENKEHEFPQRIIYEYLDATTFKTSVEGVVKDKEMKEVHLMRKVIKP